MEKVKIGIIKERKVPVDKRVPFTPAHIEELKEKFPNIEWKVEPSEIRCFEDQDYQAAGALLSDDLSDCDILFGVKEVPVEHLLPNKSYFFFSHTIKEQPYNQDLMRAVIKKNITLTDYELLTNEEGARIVAFGRYAGIVGAYNGILTYGTRFNLFKLRRAHECFDFEDLKTEFRKVQLPAIKIVLTGGGRVARGAMEVLDGMGIRKVTPYDFIHEDYKEAVYTQLNSRDYNRPKDGSTFSRKAFYNSPEKFEGDFLKFAKKADLLIAGAFWDPGAPVLFTREDILGLDFKIRVIADITCDIEGSIPSTKRPATIEAPVYDYNPCDDQVETAYREEGNITVMAVDNLPCELPRDASRDFGRELSDHVIPALLNGDDMIKRATIARDGQLSEKFKYLSQYAGLKEKKGS